MVRTVAGSRIAELLEAPLAMVVTSATTMLNVSGIDSRRNGNFLFLLS